MAGGTIGLYEVYLYLSKISKPKNIYVYIYICISIPETISAYLHLKIYLYIYISVSTSTNSRSPPLRSWPGEKPEGTAGNLRSHLNPNVSRVPMYSGLL